MMSKLAISNQQAYYDSITASNAAGTSTPFIEFMLGEILAALEKHQGNDKRVLLLLNSNPTFTSQKIADILGVTKRAGEKIIKRFRENSLVERIGNNKTGYWKVCR